MGRRVYAWVRRGAAFVAITLVVTLGMPAQNVTSYGPVSWSHLWSWLATPPAWSDPVTPETQATGDSRVHSQTFRMLVA